MIEIIPIALFTSSFLFGLTSSLHCVSMCGPFIATMNMSSNSTWANNSLYHLGRMSSYMILGFLLGYLSLGIHFTGDLLQIRLFAAIISGVFVILLGLAMVLSNNPSSDFFGKFVKKLLSPILIKISKHSSQKFPVFLFGLFTGLLPCGVLYPAFALAFVSGNPVTGALLMGAFFSGTFPLLFLFGTGLNKIKARMSPRILSYTGIFFIIIGLVSIFMRLGHDHSSHVQPIDDNSHEHMHHH